MAGQVVWRDGEDEEIVVKKGPLVQVRFLAFSDGNFLRTSERKRVQLCTSVFEETGASWDDPARCDDQTTYRSSHCGPLSKITSFCPTAVSGTVHRHASPT